MRPRGWLLLGAGGVVVPAATATDGPLPLLVYFPLCALGIAVMVGAARRLRATDPRAAAGWWCTAGGFALWFVGDVLQVLRSDAPAAGQVTAAAPAYLLGYLPLAAGLLLMARRAASRHHRRGAVLEGAVVSASLALLGLVLAVGPALATATPDRVAQLVQVAYTAGDVLLVALAAHLLAVSHDRTPVLLAAAAGPLLVLVSDCAWLVVGTTPELDWVFAAGVLVCNLAWAAAAAAAAAAPAPRPPLGRPCPPGVHGLSRRRLALLGVAAVLPVVLLGLVASPDGTATSAWVLASAVGVGVLVSVLVVLRLAEALRAARSAARAVDLLRRDLEHRATHDALTGLADRTRTRAFLTDAVDAVRAGSSPGAGVLFVDLDGFKAVNDAHGHRAGDDVLRATAARARAAVRGSDLVGRLGGDEFVVVLAAVEGEDELVAAAHRLLADLSRPLDADGRRVGVGASIGAVLLGLAGAASGPGTAAGARSPGELADALLHEADTAAYRAKALGRGRVVLYDDVLRAEAAERAAVESELRTALAEDQLVLHYQPVVDLRRGDRVDGVEALVRWHRPGHGLVGPDAFVSVAEGSDLVCDLGRWVLRTALRQQAAWARSAPGGRAPGVGVNVAPRHLAQPSFVEEVLHALAEHGTDPGTVVLEVTETQVLDSGTALDNLRQLREAGLRVAIDDFGTGYTSIGQLRHLPCDVLKVDRSLVAAADPGTAALLALVTSAGHALGATVLAEGVETVEHEAAVRAAGVDYAQGWRWSRAVPAAELDGVFRTGGVRIPAPALPTG